MIALLANPERRYFRAFTTLLGAWLGAMAVPSLGLHVEGDGFLVTFAAQGPGTVSHIVFLALSIALLLLDFAIRRGQHE